jgi:hypothetical protein
VLAKARFSPEQQKGKRAGTGVSMTQLAYRKTVFYTSITRILHAKNSFEFFHTFWLLADEVNL